MRRRAARQARARRGPRRRSLGRRYRALPAERACAGGRDGGARARRGGAAAAGGAPRRADDALRAGADPRRRLRGRAVGVRRAGVPRPRGTGAGQRRPCADGRIRPGDGRHVAGRRRRSARRAARATARARAAGGARRRPGRADHVAARRGDLPLRVRDDAARPRARLPRFAADGPRSREGGAGVRPRAGAARAPRRALRRARRRAAPHRPAPDAVRAAREPRLGRDHGWHARAARRARPRPQHEPRGRGGGCGGDPAARAAGRLRRLRRREPLRVGPLHPRHRLVPRARHAAAAGAQRGRRTAAAPRAVPGRGP